MAQNKRHGDIKLNLAQMAQGKLQERFQYEMQKIVENILDRNTDEKAKRKLTLEIDFIPQKGRRMVNVEIKSKVKLASDEPIETNIVLNGQGDSAEYGQGSFLSDDEIDDTDGKVVSITKQEGVNT